MAETAAPAAARPGKSMRSFPRSIFAPVAFRALLLVRAALTLGVEPALLRRARRLGRDALLRHVCGHLQDFGEACTCVIAVLRLVAKAAGLDDEHAVGGQA